jgi:3-hydroxy acid dehydrogenase / malonic semialdehyde reductase
MSLKGKIVCVTGASSGIGAACVAAFAEAGARLLVCARRSDRLHQLVVGLSAKGVEAYAFELDVRDRDAVGLAFDGLPKEWSEIDLLLNNAGLSRGLEPVHQGRLDDWDEMLQTNVQGLLYVSRAVLPGMVSRGRGHVINIGSVAGHEVYPNGAVYCASKHAVGAITAGMRLDLNGTGVKVSTVDPGLVNTEFSQVRFHGDQERAAQTYRGMTPLSGADVAASVLWVAQQPAHVNVAEVLLFPADQASATVVQRRG